MTGKGILKALSHLKLWIYSAGCHLFHLSAIEISFYDGWEFVHPFANTFGHLFHFFRHVVKGLSLSWYLSDQSRSKIHNLTIDWGVIRQTAFLISKSASIRHRSSLITPITLIDCRLRPLFRCIDPCWENCWDDCLCDYAGHCCELVRVCCELYGVWLLIAIWWSLVVCYEYYGICRLVCLFSD